MSLFIQKAGMLTTIQDLGRTGFKRFGINQNGVMDRAAARLINVLLGNDENEAVLEMHFPAGEILFEDDAVFATGGADFGGIIGENQVENWRVIGAQKGDVLRFTKKLHGNRGYLSVKGGFKLGKWRGSLSTNLAANIGGFNGRKLRKGDRIEIDKVAFENDGAGQSISKSLIPIYSSFPTVRVIAGAEFEFLTDVSQEAFLTEHFLVTNDSNRMGFRLKGGPLYPLHPIQLTSSAVTFGTIQLLPDRQLIVLMADHQTSGGYPRIANVIEMDLPLLAQLGPNDKVAFHPVSLAEAEELIIQFEKDLNMLKIGCNFGRYR